MMTTDHVQNINDISKIYIFNTLMKPFTQIISFYQVLPHVESIS